MFESWSLCYFLFYFKGLWLLMLCIVLLPFCHLVRLVSVVFISVSSPFVVWYLCIYCLSLHFSFVVSSVVLCRIFLHVCVSAHSVFSCKIHRVWCLVHGLQIFCVLWELIFNAAFWGYSCLSIPASRSTSLLSFHDNFFTKNYITQHVCTRHKQTFLTLHSFGCGKKDYICKSLRKLNLSYTVLQKAKKEEKRKERPLM